MGKEFNPSDIKLIVGLGNPGRRFEGTYHNAGHMLINYLKAGHRSPVTGYRLRVTDYPMNQSGIAVRKMLDDIGCPPEQLLVVHDDSDIALGSYKFSFGRGTAGHKGVESVVKRLGTNRFWRLRIGIRSAREKRPADNFVTSTMRSAHRKVLEKVFAEVTEILERTQNGD